MNNRVKIERRQIIKTDKRNKPRVCFQLLIRYWKLSDEHWSRKNKLISLRKAKKKKKKKNQRTQHKDSVALLLSGCVLYKVGLCYWSLEMRMTVLVEQEKKLTNELTSKCRHIKENSCQGDQTYLHVMIFFVKNTFERESFNLHWKSTLDHYLLHKYEWCNHDYSFLSSELNPWVSSSKCYNEVFDIFNLHG